MDYFYMYCISISNIGYRFDYFQICYCHIDKNYVRKLAGWKHITRITLNLFRGRKIKGQGQGHQAD